MLIGAFIFLSPSIAGTVWMWIRRDYWAPELAKITAKLCKALSGEFKTSLKEIDNTTQKIFVGHFLQLKWNATGDHAKALQTIDVKPAFMKKTRFLSKEKNIPAYWVATLKYSRLPKDGRTDLIWI
jgi:hypothetical protein